GFASGPSSAKSRIIVPPLVAAGMSVTVPDLNEGDFERLTVTRQLARVRRLMRDRTILVGSSHGGYVAALAASKDERVKGLVLLAPAFDFAPRMRARFGADVLATWQRLGRTFVEHYALGGLHAIGYELLADAERHAQRPPLRVPTYILHGRRDDTVPASTSEEIAARSAGVVELDLVDDDHSLVASAPRALAAVEGMITRLGLARAPSAPDLERVRAKLAALDA
ncbi:alpha/beta fold hydrolase, partial [Myxococcota bacterium]|nr:alpha/beta fold hydrolase [Myxococcota bacterium]